MLLRVQKVHIHPPLSKHSKARGEQQARFTHLVKYKDMVDISSEPTRKVALIAVYQLYDCYIVNNKKETIT